MCIPHGFLGVLEERSSTHPQPLLAAFPSRSYFPTPTGVFQNHLPNTSQGLLPENHSKTKTARTSSLKPARQTACLFLPAFLPRHPPPPRWLWSPPALIQAAEEDYRLHVLSLGSLCSCGSSSSLTWCPKLSPTCPRLRPEPTWPGSVGSQAETLHIRRSESSFKISKNKI